MSDDGWEQIVSMLDHGWPGEFGDDAAATYRLFLDAFPAVDVAREVAKRVKRGDTFRPSGAELCGALTPDTTTGRGSSAALARAMQRDREQAEVRSRFRAMDGAVASEATDDPARALREIDKAVREIDKIARIALWGRGS